MKTRNATVPYALIQGLYWADYALMFTYLSAYLLAKGISNTLIGVILGVAYGASALLQPFVVRFLRERRIRMNVGTAGMFVPITVLSLLIAFAPLGETPLIILLTAALTLQCASTGLVNGLFRDHELAGEKVNFGAARAFGSFAFSLVCFFMGKLLVKISPVIVPKIYAAVSAVLLVILLLFTSPVPAVSEETKLKRSLLLLREPKFIFFVLGRVFITVANGFILSFMLQIALNIGGNSATMGLASSISGVCEVPGMALYSRIRKKIGARFLMLFAAWMWFMKFIAVGTASTPAVLCAVSAIQLFGLGLYVPATSEFLKTVLPKEDFAEGQATESSAYALGSMLSTLIGGTVLDRFGVAAALRIDYIFAFIGACMFTIAVFIYRYGKDKG